MKDIQVDVSTHRKTGLLVGTSEDLPGLYAHGRTFADLERALPVAIQAILAAKWGVAVSVAQRGMDRPSGFVPSALRFGAVVSPV